MTLRHIGIRPIYNIELLDFKRKIYIEEFPDGSYKLWNKRQLKSGCNRIAWGEVLEMRDCYYCPTCDEWFNKNQWERK